MTFSEQSLAELKKTLERAEQLQRDVRELRGRISIVKNANFLDCEIWLRDFAGQDLYRFDCPDQLKRELRREVRQAFIAIAERRLKELEAEMSSPLPAGPSRFEALAE